jgi:hypothetical protein
MNILILVLHLIFSVLTAQSQEPVPTETGSFSGHVFPVVVCPGPNDTNTSIVEDFLTKPDWTERRAAANVGSLSVSQVKVLTDSNDGSVCSSFYETYQGFFEEENGIGEPAYNITYYKAGNFYFVVITIQQSNNPDYVGFGVSYIIISDQNLDLIKAYAF